MSLHAKVSSNVGFASSELYTLSKRTIVDKKRAAKLLLVCKVEMAQTGALHSPACPVSQPHRQVVPSRSQLHPQPTPGEERLLAVRPSRGLHQGS
jgi:hypothetical protein